MSNFERRDWETVNACTLSLEPTAKDDPDIVLRIDFDGCVITAETARAFASELVRRADLVDPPKRNWTDAPSTPEAIIGDFLHSGKVATEHIFGADGETPAESSMRIAHLCTAFAVVALMAELAAAAPKRAAAISKLLADAWDSGDTVHELIWEWSEDHAAGKPVGFEPDQVLELEVTRDA